MTLRYMIIAVACATCWSAAAPADDLTPVDEVVSAPSVGLSDPEFDHVGNRIAWQVLPDEGPFVLMTANVDPVNGDILDPTTGVPLNQGGAGLMIDTDLADLDVTGNGPEWAFGASGSQIVYTKFNESAQMALARATFDGVQWVPELLMFGHNRFVPKGSEDVDDPAPRIGYYGVVAGPTGPERRLAVRTIDMPGSEQSAPMLSSGGNFLPNETAFLTTAQPSIDRPAQVYVFDYDAEIFQQITFEPGYKLQSPEPWVAPDFRGMALVANVNFQTYSVARVYRRPDPADNFTWLPQISVRSPVESKPYVKSPRPFVFEGKSYIVFMVQAHPTQSRAAEIWISDLVGDPELRFYRKVSAGTSGVRFDPEIFNTTTGPIIYYSHITTGALIVLRRAQTGLLVTP